MSKQTNETLNERESRYGSFEGQSILCQTLKDTMRETGGWWKLNPTQRESLEMIQHKIARILNGDPNYADSWHDIAGYATLIDNMLGGKE